MNDLDWLARNVHEWPAGEHQPWCYVYWKGGRRAVSGNCITVIQPCVRIEKSDWLASRAELQNKPRWDQHSWPQIFQNEDGHWFGARDGWDFYAHIGSGWKGDGVSMLSDDGEYLQTGTVLGDWRDTLEKRPEQAEFEPFVSVEDAATAKQHDPVNNPSHYASGGIECIEAIKASMSHEAFLGYLKGNAQKYTWRYEKKVNPAEDLKKAQWYLSKLIDEQFS